MLSDTATKKYCYNIVKILLGPAFVTGSTIVSTLIPVSSGYKLNSSY